MSFLARFNRKTAGETQSAPADETAAAMRQPAGSAWAVNAPPAPGATHEILLDLGDFLPQIPPGLVRAGAHPAEARLKFDMTDLADRIACGKTSIRLAEIHRQMPEIFLGDAPPSDDLEIPFPWDKVMKLLANARTTAAMLPKAGGASPAGADAVSHRRAILSVVPIQPAGVVLLNDEKLTREEILRACDGLRAELERMKSEHERQLAALAAESGHRVQKLSEERDVLARQVKSAPAPASPAGLERSPKEHQRQVDELQRRISALESHQREAAHELSREKESRIKLERQLGSLDRLSRETTMHHEETLTALKRDFETTARKRDADSARALREAQEQFETVKAAKAALAAELETARARLAQAPPAGEAWEGRAVAQFEADLENYRRRIRDLLAERDALAGEKAALAAGSSAAAAADDEALRAERTKLSRELEAARLSSNAMITNLRAENKRLTYEREATQKEGESLLAESDAKAQAWTGERAALEAHAKALQAEITKVRQQHEITTADLRATLAEVERCGEQQVVETDAARQEQAQALAAVTGERDAALAALAEERGQVRQAATEVEQKLSAEVGRLTTALEAARRESAGSAQGLAAATAEADRKFDVAQREREALLAERRILEAELESAKGALATRDSDSGRQLQSVSRQRDEALAEIDRLREELRRALGDVASAGRGSTLQPGAEPALRELRPEQPASVIEIHEAEILPPPTQEAGWLKIPLIRPVPVPPPQFQNH